ncbi:uncharacterized protein METZ01_LOCUS67838 [marine metagenome]|uniref:Uncharacterized protein n=1 Tax=marine metagenome TaxID=408172 RepID=A0A381TGT8_9ZZZZ
MPKIKSPVAKNIMEYLMPMIFYVSMSRNGLKH